MCSECIKMHHLQGENTQIFLWKGHCPSTDPNPTGYPPPSSIKSSKKKPYQGFTLDPTGDLPQSLFVAHFVPAPQLIFVNILVQQ